MCDTFDYQGIFDELWRKELDERERARKCGISVEQLRMNRVLNKYHEKNALDFFKEPIVLTKWKKFCCKWGTYIGNIGGKHGEYVGSNWSVGHCKNCGASYPCEVVGRLNGDWTYGPILKCGKCGKLRIQTDID